MHLRTKLALVVVMVMAFLPSAGNAYACDGGHRDSGVAAATFTLRHHHGFVLLRASAAYLGTTVDRLKTQLRSGESLAQIANATPGKSDDGLVDYLAGLVKHRLDSLVTAGRLTSAQESAIMTRVHAKLTRVVAFDWTARSR